jgi:hypothetical protein
VVQEAIGLQAGYLRSVLVARLGAFGLLSLSSGSVEESQNGVELTLAKVVTTFFERVDLLDDGEIMRVSYATVRASFLTVGWSRSIR